MTRDVGKCLFFFGFWRCCWFLVVAVVAARALSSGPHELLRAMGHRKQTQKEQQVV